MRKPLTEVWLKTIDLELMLDECRRFSPMETGGVFIGYRAKGSIVISDVVLSGPNAIHKRRSYRSDLVFEHTEIARLYEKSGRINSYLGDWHTHPDGPLGLSYKDKAALRRVAKSADARVEQPIMAILADQEDDWGIRVWEYVEKRIAFFSVAVRSTLLKFY